MLETAEAGREGKPLLRFSEARDLFEDDPRWKVTEGWKRDPLCFTRSGGTPHGFGCTRPHYVLTRCLAASTRR